MPHIDTAPAPQPQQQPSRQPATHARVCCFIAVVTLVAVVTPSLEFNVIAIPDVEEESVVHSNSQYIMYVLTWSLEDTETLPEIGGLPKSEPLAKFSE